MRHDDYRILYGVNDTARLTGVDRIHAVVGGFHLGGRPYEERIPDTVRDLAALGPDYLVPLHCTGWKATRDLSVAMPDRFILGLGIPNKGVIRHPTHSSGSAQDVINELGIRPSRHRRRLSRCCPTRAGSGCPALPRMSGDQPCAREDPQGSPQGP